MIGILCRVAYATLGMLLALACLAHAHAASSVTLEWDYVQEPSHLATGFILERCQGTTCTAFLPLNATPLPLTPPLYTDSSGKAGQTYRWQVRAVDAQGGTSVPSNAITFSLPPEALAVPGNLRGVLGP